MATQPTPPRVPFSDAAPGTEAVAAALYAASTPRLTWPDASGKRLMTSCAVCGTPVVNRVLSKPGRPAWVHKGACKRVADAQAVLRMLLEEEGHIPFDDSPESCAAQRELRAWFWSAANWLNNTPGNGGSGNKRRVVHGMKSFGRTLCGSDGAHRPPARTVDAAEVTCKHCLRVLARTARASEARNEGG